MWSPIKAIMENVKYPRGLPRCIRVLPKSDTPHSIARAVCEAFASTQGFPQHCVWRRYHKKTSLNKGVPNIRGTQDCNILGTTISTQTSPLATKLQANHLSDPTLLLRPVPKTYCSAAGVKEFSLSFKDEEAPTIYYRPHIVVIAFKFLDSNPDNSSNLVTLNPNI